MLGTIGAGAVGLSSGAAADSHQWTRSAAPTAEDLNDVVHAGGSAYAVGDGGVVLEGTGGEWSVVVEGGPSGDGNDLYGVDATADGERLWFVGASGAVGEYCLPGGTLVDHSNPDDTGDNFNDVAVTGTGGAAEVYAANDSGTVFYSFENGRDGTWNDVTPGDGSALVAVDLFAERSGHLVAGTGTVFETTDGETWEEVGIEDADGGLLGLDSNASNDVWVCADGGRVFHYNGLVWRSEEVASVDLADVAVAPDRSGGYAVGGSGSVFQYDGLTWSEDETPTGENLAAVSRSTTDVAVGDGGTVVEK